MGPAATGELRLDYAVTGTHRFDHLSVADVHANVSVVPDGEAGDLRDGADGSGLGGRVVHLVCADVRHPVGAVDDALGVGIVPAVALDEPHAVGGAPPDPMLLNEVRIVSDALRVLLQLGLERALRQHIAEGSPDVAPAGLVGVGHVGHQPRRGLVRISSHGREIPIGIVVPAQVTVVAVVLPIAHVACDHPVDVRDVVGVLIGDLSAEERGHVSVGGAERERHGADIAFFFLCDFTVLALHLHSARCLLYGIEAVHKAVGGPRRGRGLAIAEGKENSLDPDGIKAVAILHLRVCRGDGGIQKGEGRAHFPHMVFQLPRRFVREFRAVEAGFHHIVVVRGLAGAKGAEEGDDQDQRRQRRHQDPAHRLAALFAGEDGECQLDELGFHRPPAFPKSISLYGGA